MLGVVILNFNTWETTITCVESVIATCSVPYKIFIVDNCSANSSFEILAQTYSSRENIRVVRNDVNGGYAQGNNAGIKHALNDGCEYVLITNNDISFLNGAIDRLFEFIQSTPNAILVGPKIYSPSGQVQYSSMIREQKYIEYLGIYPLRIHRIDEENIEEAVPVYSVSGCCFLVKAKAFVEIGAFDEGTFLYNEENILGAQISASKYKLYFVPNSAVIHEHGGTTGKASMFINGEVLKSALYYWRKYRQSGPNLLLLMWVCFTLRWAIKTLYTKNLRSGWKRYLAETSCALMNEIQHATVNE